MTKCNQLMCMNVSKLRVFVVFLALIVAGTCVFYVKRNDIVRKEKSHSNQTCAQKIIYNSPIREKVSAEPTGVLMTNPSLPDPKPISDENMTSLTQHVSRKAYGNDAAQMASDKGRRRVREEEGSELIDRVALI